MGGEAAIGARHQSRVQSGSMAAGAIRGSNEGGESRIVDQKLGTPIGDSVARIDRGVCEPLRVEFDGGELERGGTDDRVADGGGAGVQLEDAGGGNGDGSGAGEGKGE